MPFVEWEDRYSINVVQVDQQHRRLFDLINELHEAMPRGHSGVTTREVAREQDAIEFVVRELATMADVLDELLDYASYHFSTEEKHMLTRTYPEYTVHKSAHTQFVERIGTFKRDFDEGRALSPIEIVQFLRGWLTRHILVMDKKLGKFLNKHGLT